MMEAFSLILMAVAVLSNAVFFAVFAINPEQQPKAEQHRTNYSHKDLYCTDLEY